MIPSTLRSGDARVRVERACGTPLLASFLLCLLWGRMQVGERGTNRSSGSLAPMPIGG